MSNNSGSMPDSWMNTQLSNFASDEPNSFVDGPFGSDLKVSDYTDDGIRILQLQNLGDGHFIDDNVKFTSNLKAASLSRCMVRPGDLLIAKMADPLARACIVPNKVERGLIVADLIKLRLNRQNDPTFMVSAINGTDFRREAERLSTGTTRTRISLSTLKRICLKAPPSIEQRRIGNLIRTLDEAIEQAEALIAKHSQIKAGLMHDLLTRGVTPDGHLRPTREQAPNLYKESPLGWIPKEWDACSIELLLDRIIDYRGKTPTKTVEGIPLITAKNVRMGYIDPEPREFVAEKDYPTWMTRGIPVNTDVLFTTEAPLGNVAQIGTNEKVAFAQRVIILQPAANACPNFLRILLMAEPFQRSVLRLSSGTTALGVKQSEFRKVMVAYPVLREEQLFISDKLQALEAYEAMEADRMKKLRQQKQGLMHDLLTGHVRVPEPTNVAVCN